MSDASYLVDPGTGAIGTNIRDSDENFIAVSCDDKEQWRS
jgi:hypothetical protein